MSVLFSLLFDAIDCQGRNVILDQTYGPPRITKDGVSVAKEIEFKDRSVNLGAQLVRAGMFLSSYAYAYVEEFSSHRSYLMSPTHNVDEG